MPPKDLKDLYVKIIEHTGLDSKEREKLLDDVRKLQSPEGNRWNFRYVIFSLALLALSVPIYAMWQLALGVESRIPDALLSIAATGVGALAGFMTQTLQSREEGGAESTPADPGRVT
jgi:hypothetical protein